MALQKKKFVAPVVEIPRQQQSKQEESYETADQIALRLHVKPSTIYDWAGRSENPLPAYRVTNRHYLFLWSEVNQWVKQGGTLRRRVA